MHRQNDEDVVHWLNAGEMVPSGQALLTGDQLLEFQALSRELQLEFVKELRLTISNAIRPERVFYFVPDSAVIRPQPPGSPALSNP